MLSFQKEQGPETAVNGADKPEKTDATPKLENDSSQYYTVSDKKQQLKHSTYLLIGLFVIGALCLWFMIRKTSPSAVRAAQPPASQSEQTQIEAAIARITGVRSQMFSGLEKIVKKFYEFANVEQVNVDELNKNPFRTDNGFGELKPSDKQNITVAKSELELLTIMAGGNGYCCMINDKLLYEGDSIRGLTVTKITDKFVVLQGGETHLLLKLED
ncbi:MAG: hypothetical protein PVG93_04655 [Phycisphaerales bacterium]|jgi:hypothetical protein